jgi:YggT family protein
MRALLDVIMLALDFYVWIIIISAVLSWLLAFNVINPHNQVVNTILRALYGLTEPVLRPIRRFLPDLGGIDISPIIVLFAIFFIQRLIAYNIYPLFV